MKLLVIVLCLLSERFLVHVGSHHRFQLFTGYGHLLSRQLSRLSFLSSPWLILALTVLPWLLIVSLMLSLFGGLLFGFVGLLFNILLFYCCIGPENPFYPIRAQTVDHVGDNEVGNYLANVNEQLFSVLFWYILLGPLAALAYRLISLCRNQTSIGQQALWLTNILDWLPVRMTLLLYLLVGNFQAGARHFSKSFFLTPANNHAFLSGCGMEALRGSESEPIVMPNAENLVEHAVIVLLVLLACFTLSANLS